MLLGDPRPASRPLPPLALAAAWGTYWGGVGLGGKRRSHGAPSWSGLSSSLSSGPIPLSSLVKGLLPVSSELPGCVGFLQTAEPQIGVQGLTALRLCDLRGATASVTWVKRPLQRGAQTAGDSRVPPGPWAASAEHLLCAGTADGAGDAAARRVRWAEALACLQISAVSPWAGKEGGWGGGALDPV